MQATVQYQDDGTLRVNWQGVDYVVKDAHFTFEDGEPSMLLNHVLNAPVSEPKGYLDGTSFGGTE